MTTDPYPDFASPTANTPAEYLNARRGAGSLGFDALLFTTWEPNFATKADRFSITSRADQSRSRQRELTGRRARTRRVGRLYPDPFFTNALAPETVVTSDDSFTISTPEAYPAEGYRIPTPSKENNVMDKDTHADLLSEARRLRDMASELGDELSSLYSDLPNDIDHLASQAESEANGAASELEDLIGRLEDYPVGPVEVRVEPGDPAVEIDWDRDDQAIQVIRVRFSRGAPEAIRDPETGYLTDEAEGQCGPYHNALDRLNGARVDLPDGSVLEFHLS